MKKFMPSNEVFERYMDASVELFMECYAETIPINTDNALQEDCSSQLQDKCKALIKANHRQRRTIRIMKGTWRVFKSAAVIAIAILSLSSFLFMTVEAVRKPIMNFYIQQNDGNWLLSSNLLRTDPNNPESPMTEGFNEEDPLGALLPDDFYLHSAEGNLKEGITAVYYNNDQKVISFTSVCSDSAAHINTENADVERMTIGEYDAVLSVQKDTKHAVLAWYNSDLEIFVTLTTDSISEEELIRIAQVINQQLMH